MRTTARWRTVTAALSVAVLGGITLTGCGGEEESGDGGLIVWSLENQTERIAATQAIANKFGKKSGVDVKVVAVDENQFTQLITSAAAADELPDVVAALPLAAVWQMAGNELLDRDAAAAVVKGLDEGTFSPRALELTRDEGKQLSVPSDAWAQLLVYRKDLFDAAKLPAPDSFETIQQAAKQLHKKGLAGVTMATVANDAFTAQSFEFLALGNNCQMVDDSGKVTLDAPECVGTFGFYGDLVKNHSVKGDQDVDTTRATYFAGEAAMVLWSSFILDEMAGLRNDAKPNCAECEDDPAFLAKNSGVVTAVKGPNGTEPLGYGELTSWAITAGADPKTQDFVKFIMDEGYLDWLGIAPEGKFPARKGTATEPEKYVDAWNDLPAGVDTKKPLSEVYPAEVLEALRNSPDTFARWGITQGQGQLVGATLGELPIPKAINALAGGETDAAGACKQATEQVKSIQASLE